MTDNFSSVSGRSSPLFLLAPAAAIGLVILYLLNIHETGEPRLAVEKLPVSTLPGWALDDLENAASTYAQSCAGFANRADDTPFNPREALGENAEIHSVSGVTVQWRRLCDLAAVIDNNDAFRNFLEVEFTAVKLSLKSPRKSFAGLPWMAKSTDHGLLTGYDEPEFEGSPAQSGTHSAALLTRPADLVTVDLGSFRTSLAGERIAGRVVNGRLEPYEDRETIENGALAGITQPIAWLRPADAFDLQIQGSGRVRFDDDRVVRVGYAGQNGHPYTSIGRLLVERKEMVLENVSMQTIKEWLENAGPERSTNLMQENASYVFFREVTAIDPNLGPRGGSGVALTPRRSLAIDTRFTPYGAPVWVDGQAPTGANGEVVDLKRLFIAQDTGGAIRGALRGDVFWGSGDEARRIAGSMRAEAAFYILLPNRIADALQADP